MSQPISPFKNHTSADRKLYYAVTDWLVDAPLYYDTDKAALEDMLELCRGWAEQWVSDSKERP